MKTLVQLLQKKASVEAQIRAQRVRTIRALKVNHLDAMIGKNDPKFDKAFETMETWVAGVFYDHTKFDDLLEELEILLGLEEA